MTTMTRELKTLPIAALSFEEIIQDGYLYADKTGYIIDLVKKKKLKQYFLSRPRRFGKSLLLDTMEQVFLGRKDLFKGLAIEALGYDFLKFPVISLSLSIDSKNPETLEKALMATLKIIARRENVEVEEAPTLVYFGALIEGLYYKNDNTKVVVLIDEYDAPVTAMIGDQKIAEANAQSLNHFFVVLKKKEEFIHFSLVTGITRYALTSMDSGPNHLIDISLDPKYAGICGFSLEEFDSLFVDRLESTSASLKNTGDMRPYGKVEELRREIYEWYDGYNWGGETKALNPFSILHFFSENAFGGYWVQSGRPGRLTAMIKAYPLNFLKPRLETYLSDEVRKTDLGRAGSFPQRAPDRGQSNQIPSVELGDRKNKDC
jgi:hypothetical protein